MTAITTDNVSEAFDEVAVRYDQMVGLNPGYHDHLRAAAEALVERLPEPAGRSRQPPHPARRPRLRLRGVDPRSGATPPRRRLRAEVVGIDASAGMLEQARAKSWPPGVRFEVGMAEDLAFARESWGLGEPVPGVFAAYLFRNVTERDKVLAAVYDLLADEGTFVVQEYSVAGSRLAAFVWTLVCWSVVIPLSWLTSRQTRLYRYLWRSVLGFDSVGGVRRSAVRRGVLRRRGADGAGLAARHPAHLPGPQAGGRRPS